MEDVSPAILLGLDPLWLSTGIFLCTYALLISERVHRTVAVMLGAGLMAKNAVAKGRVIGVHIGKSGKGILLQFLWP